MPRITRCNVVKLLRETARDSDRVVITAHAEQRMKQRGITRRHVQQCFKFGAEDEPPEWDSQHDCFKVRLLARVAGLQVTIVAALDEDEEGRLVVVITAF